MMHIKKSMKCFIWKYKHWIDCNANFFLIVCLFEIHTYYLLTGLPDSTKCKCIGLTLLTSGLSLKLRNVFCAWMKPSSDDWIMGIVSGSSHWLESAAINQPWPITPAVSGGSCQRLAMVCSDQVSPSKLEAAREVRRDLVPFGHETPGHPGQVSPDKTWPQEATI